MCIGSCVAIIGGIVCLPSDEHLIWIYFWLVDVDDDDEEDDEDAEEGYDEIVAQGDKSYVRDEGPSARDIDGLLRGKDMWR